MDDDVSWKQGEGVWIAPDGQLKVIYSEELDHAQIFDSKRRLPGLVDEVLRHLAGVV